MPKKFLDITYINVVFKERCCECMSKHMRSDSARYSGLRNAADYTSDAFLAQTFTVPIVPDLSKA